MNLNDLLAGRDIDPRQVLVLRHRPREPRLNKALPWLAAENPDLFNAYQQTQGPTVERILQKMVGNGNVASFIRHGPGRGLFVGMYSIDASKALTHEKFWRLRSHDKLKELGMRGWIKKSARKSALWFDLNLIDFYADWKGKLIVGWPPPERSWYRRAHRNEMPVLAVLEDSALDASMPSWDEIDLTWEQLNVLPKSWIAALKQWRGVITSSTPRPAWATSARPMVTATFTADGSTTLPAATVETACFGREILGTSDSRYCNEFRRICTPTT